MTLTNCLVQIIRSSESIIQRIMLGGGGLGPPTFELNIATTAALHNKG